MRAMVWISESTWEGCVDRARELIPDDAEVVLLHVSPSDAEELAEPRPGRLLGRRPPPPPGPALRVVATEEAEALLSQAQARLGRPAELVTRRGRVEREVVRASADVGLLVLARDGEPRLGPRSLGRHTRFVVDHAACPVLVLWPGTPPGVETIPPSPKRS
jgi:nucleotide-binding universal stress UspA family protein